MTEKVKTAADILFEDGLQQGLAEATRKFVINLIHEGFSDDRIAYIADVSINEVKKIRKELNK